MNTLQPTALASPATCLAPTIFNYCNRRQTASSFCVGGMTGETIEIVIPAGRYSGVTQEAADAVALGIAQARVDALREATPCVGLPLTGVRHSISDNNDVVSTTRCLGVAGDATLCGYSHFITADGRRFRRRATAGSLTRCGMTQADFPNCGEPDCPGGCSVTSDFTSFGDHFHTVTSATQIPGGAPGTQRYRLDLLVTDNTIVGVGRISLENIASPGVVHYGAGDEVNLPIGNVYNLSCDGWDGGSFIGSPDLCCFTAGLPLLTVRKDTWNRSEQYDPDDCTLGRTDGSYRQASSEMSCGSSSGSHDPLPAEGLSPNTAKDCYAAEVLDFQTVNSSEIVRTTLPITDCRVIDIFGNYKLLGAVTETLSDEDLPADAILRALGADFMDIDDEDLEEQDTCEAFISPRNSSGQFTFKKVKIQVLVAPGLLTNGVAYKVRVYYCARDYLTGSFEATGDFDEVSFTASPTDVSAGYTSPWFEVPCLDGIETIVC